MPKGKFRILIIIGIACAIAISSCGTQQPAEEAGSIKIGMIAPLTGAQQFEGQKNMNAAQMAVNEINDEGGLLGRPVTLIVEDSEASPAVAVSAVEKLITKDGIVALQGAQWSSLSKAVMPLLEENGVPAVTAISTAPDITEGDLPGQDWMFRIIPHDGLIAEAVANFMLNDLEAKTLAFLVKNDDWGRQNVEVITAAFEEGGGEVLTVEYYEGGETNFLPQLTKIKGLNPDVLLLTAQAQDGSIIAKQINEVGLDIPAIGLGAFASGTFVELAGDAAEGIYGAVQYVDSIDTTENQAFVDKWTERYPQSGLPDKYVWGPYTAVKVILEAIRIAESTDPAAIRDALEEVSMDTLTGKIEFDENHQAHPNAYITVIEDGKVNLLQAIETE